MKLAILSGAYKNAGDYLIVDRSIKLLTHLFPECEYTVYERRKPLDGVLDQINAADAVIFAGGPAYTPNIYPAEIPLVDDLSKIKTKMITMGLGWYGPAAADYVIYDQYQFTDDTKRLLTRLESDGGLACRDWYSVRALKNNGFHRAVMTGCPAWYHLDTLDQLQLRKGIHFPYQKICISDPANPANIEQSLDVAKYLRHRYPAAEISFVFHRGIQQDAMTDASIASRYLWLSEQLQQAGIQVKDISYSKDGFEYYNDCDLHLGYRVHAHIYNLSLRNISVLLEEDGRGAGVNNALGLWGIPTYQPDMVRTSRTSQRTLDRAKRYLERKLFPQSPLNPYLLASLDDDLSMMEQNHDMMFRTAFQTMRVYYDAMADHLKKNLL